MEINYKELIERGTYCSDWSAERIAASRHSLKEYVAYCYWDDAGRPEGRDGEFWKMAEDYLDPTKDSRIRLLANFNSKLVDNTVHGDNWVYIDDEDLADRLGLKIGYNITL